MRSALVVAVVLSGCTSNPCKKLLSEDDVRAALNVKLFTNTHATDRSCAVSIVETNIRHGYELDLQLERVQRSAAARLEAEVEERKKRVDAVPLEGFGDAAFISLVPMGEEPPLQDPNVVVDQMLQRAAVERANERVNALSQDAGTFDAMPEALKRAPRNVGDYLARLPPRQHVIYFRQHDWVGTLSVDKDALTEAQLRDLLKVLAPRVAKLD
ncbi:MAG: hypothetical protein ACO1OB_34630 [Archangium sp.]